MGIVGVAIAKVKFDAAPLASERTRHAAFSNTEAGFEQLLARLTERRLDPVAPLHACVGETSFLPIRPRARP